MRKNGFFKMLRGLCSAVLILTLALCLCDAAGWTGISLARAESYAVGNAEISGTVRNLDIEWTSGAVTVAYHSGNTVLLEEKSDKALREDEQLRWCLDGDTLRVRYMKKGFSLFRSVTKELTVTLPEGISLEDVRIEATSATLRIPAMTAEKLKLNVTSGDIFAAANARKVSADATSGDMELRLGGEAREIDIESTSGNTLLEAESAKAVRIKATSGTLRAAVKTADEVEIKTTSGLIQAMIGQAETISLKSTSGDIQLKAARFGTLSIGTTSGDVKAALAAEPGFTARFHTGSGKISHDLPLAKQGKDYLCGDGSAKLEIKTTSGDITLLPLAD